MNKFVLKISGIIMCVLCFGFLTFMLYSEQKEENRMSAYYEQLNQQLSPLQRQLHDLERELGKLKSQYQREVNGTSTLQIVCTTPVTEVYKYIYPMMKEYGYTGIIALSSEAFPGLEGYMTPEQALELYEAGWQFCQRYDGTSFDTLQKQAEECGIVLEKAVYFKQGTYSSQEEQMLLEADYVIHHGEESKPVTAAQKEDKCYLGAMGWYTSDASDILEAVVNQGGNLVFTVGVDSSKEYYRDSQFRSMLNKISSYGNLTVTNLDSLDEYLQYAMDAVSEEEYLKQIKELEEAIKALEDQEQDITKSYMSQYE